MFEEMLSQFLGYLEQEKMLSANTLPNYESHIREFLNYLKKRNIGIEYVDRAIIKDFLLTLHERKLARQTIHIKVLMIKSFFNYCYMKSWVRTNLANQIEYIKLESKIPSFLTEQEVEEFLPLPILALRDYAILEILYSTGITLSELVAININDIYMKHKSISIRDKWRKKRFVFFGRKAAKGLGYYLRARPLLLARRSKEKGCFLNHKGERIVANTVQIIVKKYWLLSGLEKRVTPRTFRHSCASHLLGGGAATWFVQGILGHKRLATTERYCRIDIRHLKAVHKKYHPRALIEENDTQSRENIPDFLLRFH